MKRIPSSGLVTNGIDVSHHEPNIDWISVRRGGYEFAYLKATQGASRIDPKFHQSRGAARVAGVLTGAYHFYEPDVDPIVQARHFCKVVERCEADDLPPVLDLESESAAPPKIDAEHALAFIKEVVSTLKRKVVIYGSPYFLRDEYASAEGFKKSPLWIANYTSGAPLVPPPWDSWAIWQSNDKARVPGVRSFSGPTDCDVNVFNGSRDELLAFIEESKISTVLVCEPPPPPPVCHEEESKTVDKKPKGKK